MKQPKTYSRQHALRWVVLLILIAVVLPTVCLLWFMTQAIRNERMAMRQKLKQQYEHFWDDYRDTTYQAWSLLLEANPPNDLKPAGLFAFLLNPHEDSPAQCCTIEGVLIFDEQGHLRYPSPPEQENFTTLESPRAFTKAWQLEFVDRDIQAAGQSYWEIHETYPNRQVQVRAALAAIRCWRKLENWDRVLTTTESLLTEYDLSQWPLDKMSYAQLLLQWLELLKERDNTRFLSQLGTHLSEVLNYQGVWLKLNSPQRQRFLQGLLSLIPELSQPSLLNQQDLCQRYIKAEQLSDQVRRQTTPVLEDWPAYQLRSLELKDKIYAVRCDTGPWTALLLFRPESLGNCIEDCIGLKTSTDLKDLKLQVLAPDKSVILAAPQAEFDDPLTSGQFKHYWPNLTLEFYLDDEEGVLSAHAQRMTALYWWIAVLVTSAVIALALLVIRAVGRQVQLNRLKNDFIATVTHELKTPLASMRLLLDTLLEGRYRDPEQVNDYLNLMSKENHRLTGLIDNFLTFSRMERNKQSFSQRRVSPEELARDAGVALETKFSQGRCHFDLDIADNLPDVYADPDAWVTVLVNLLDNAYKYSNEDKHIVLAVTSQDGHVRFRVTDNGVGIPRRACHHIFDKFYQVDRSLSRQAEGCGLGLSIVKFIVAAHHGTVTVESQVGVGTTFTVILPAYAEEANEG